MKRAGKQFRLLMLCVSLLCAGCGKGTVSEPAKDGKLKIVCTIFPAYDWVREILGEQDADLTLLMKNGADLHSYQPTVWDMAAISDADLFVYIGGESDFWVENALANVKNERQRTVNLMEILRDFVREEETVEGMQISGGLMHEEESEEAPEKEYDEHIWLSLRNAEASCEALSKVICELDGEHQKSYERNVKNYEEKLAALDRAYGEAVSAAKEPVLLFGDRFPFCYLADDYGLSYYAAFAGCSAETEASFETITFLAEKAKALDLPAVLTIDGSDGRIARTIADNSGGEPKQVLTLDSMQSVSEKDIENGESYLKIMERNLDVLKAALGADSPEREE